MGDQKVGTMTIRGKEYEVTLQVTDYGRSAPKAQFILDSLRENRNHSGIHADTYEALYEKAMKVSKSKAIKIAIPFEAIEYTRGANYAGQTNKWGRVRQFKAGTIIGRHAGTGNFLVKWDDGKTSEQEDHYSSRDLKFRPMPEDSKVAYLALLTEQDNLSKKISDFEKTYRLSEDVSHMVDEEIERVASETVEK